MAMNSSRKLILFAKLGGEFFRIDTPGNCRKRMGTLLHGWWSSKRLPQQSLILETWEIRCSWQVLPFQFSRSSSHRQGLRYGKKAVANKEFSHQLREASSG